MDQNERKVRKNQRRRERTIQMRKDSLILEYISVKYNAIYAEANEFYNSLNQKYRGKFDLRKTEDFKVFKADMTRIEKPIEQVSEQVSDPRPQAPDFPDPPTPFRLRFGEKCIYKDTMLLRIPLALPKTVTTEIIQEDTPPVTTDSVTTEIIQEDTPPVTTDSVTTEIIQEGTPPVTTDSVTTQILPMAVDEILEDTIHPSLFDELDPNLIQEIINGLKEDPDLKDMMTNIEQQVDYEELGMDLDIDILEGYTLENELE